MKWISVKDELPIYNGKYIVAFPGYAGCASYLKSTGWWLCGNAVDGITHWMPLPPPPESPAYTPDELLGES